MKISTKSFTYKLVQQYSNSRPSNDLCDYFWQAAWCWVKAIGLWWLIASFVFMEGLTITMLFIEGINKQAIIDATGIFCTILVEHEGGMFLSVVGFVLWMAGVISFCAGNGILLIAIIGAILCFISYLFEMIVPEDDEESDGVIKEYYKSLKGKYCKQIDFVDE